MPIQVLLVGDTAEHPRAVSEIATRCRQHGVNVYLWLPERPHTGQWRAEWQALAQEIPPADSLPESVVDFIIDPCLSPTAQRAEFVRQLHTQYPTAGWLRSGLTETATACANALDFPDVVAFNGMPGLFRLLESLEIAPALTASAEAQQRAMDFFATLQFRPERVEDRIGLVIPRILAMLINEGAFAVLERLAEPHDIDTAMRLATNYPRGVLEWADEIGLDTIVAILDALYAEYHQERYRACVLLRQYVRAHRLGRHTGRGFYAYG